MEKIGIREGARMAKGKRKAEAAFGKFYSKFRRLFCGRKNWQAELRALIVKR
jgi:hypothetical protein